MASSQCFVGRRYRTVGGLSIGARTGGRAGRRAIELVYASLATGDGTVGLRFTTAFLEEGHDVDDKVSLLVQPISRRGFLQHALTGVALAGAGVGSEALVAPASAQAPTSVGLQLGWFAN